MPSAQEALDLAGGGQAGGSGGRAYDYEPVPGYMPPVYPPAYGTPGRYVPPTYAPVQCQLVLPAEPVRVGCQARRGLRSSRCESVAKCDRLWARPSS